MRRDHDSSVMLLGDTIMSKSDVMGVWVRRFLEEYLIGERNYSSNTQASYRDTLVLLLPFLAKRKKTSVGRLALSKISSDDIRSFLVYLEEDRKCSTSTRNQRLAAIHALSKFIARKSPEHIVWSQEIASVPFKKTSKPTLAYLEKDEMDAILNAPDVQTRQGKRDYALLLFLYNTGARASEAAQLKISDLKLGSMPSVRIIGKGMKVRYCPLWSLTLKTIELLIAGRPLHDPVFLNCRRQVVTRFGIHSLIRRSIARASRKVASIKEKKISPHSIRHTTAVHLLRSGVDINTIRAWLGHVSLDTTNVYAVIDLKMKADALAHCEIIQKLPKRKSWQNENTMAFLRSI